MKISAESFPPLRILGDKAIVRFSRSAPAGIPSGILSFLPPSSPSEPQAEKLLNSSTRWQVTNQKIANCDPGYVSRIRLTSVLTRSFNASFSYCRLLCNDTVQSCRYWEMHEGLSGSFVTTFQTTWYQNLEDFNLNFYSRKNLKSYVSASVCREVAADIKVSQVYSQCIVPITSI
jgi:hypothetical protein